MPQPITPPTDLELYAWIGGELECINRHPGLSFRPGKAYACTKSFAKFSYKIERLKLCQEASTASTHECLIEGRDLVIRIDDDHGREHSFTSHPNLSKGSTELDMAMLWQIFKRPAVLTVADQFPGKVKQNIETLEMLEQMVGYSYFPAQKEYIARAAVNDFGLIGAETGTGKTLVAISLITLKDARRTLICAPQGTVRDQDEDDTGLADDYHASQLVSELRKFAPHLQVFELFGFEDYDRILKANDGKLPLGVYVTYPQALFMNDALEKAPVAWDDARVYKKLGWDAPADCEGESIARSIGKEKHGIRCVLKPSLAELYGHQFDCVIIDEAHCMANLDAQITKTAIRLQPKYRFALTASPIPNLAENIFALMGWLAVPDWYKGCAKNLYWPYERSERADFIAFYGTTERDLTQEAINREKHLKPPAPKPCPILGCPSLLLRRAHSTMSYLSKSDCNPNMVECHVHDIRVPMGRQQAWLYAHFLDRENVPHDNPLVRARMQISYLRAICADPQHFAHDGPRVESNFNPKTIAVMRLVSQIVGRGEQALIVSTRIGQTNTYQDLLKEAGVKTWRIDSTIPAKDHARQANKFKEAGVGVMLMGARCAAGHSFDKCPNLITPSIEWSYGARLQTHGRVYRVNSKQPVNIWCILHEHSLEEIMFDTVLVKGDAATMILQGKALPRDFKPVDWTELLDVATKQFHMNGQVDEVDLEEGWPAIRDSIRAATGNGGEEDVAMAMLQAM